MLNPQENKDCYLSETQREVLLQLLTEPTLERQFFLTGGTALSVFYLYHRVSNDLDLFSLNQVNLGDLSFWIKTVWPRESVVIRESPHFLSCLIRQTKVEVVIDPFSINEERPSVMFENGRSLWIDTITSIVSNKLCAPPFLMILRRQHFNWKKGLPLSRKPQLCFRVYGFLLSTRIFSRSMLRWSSGSMTA
jgi:hypothetical protein